MLNDAIPKMRVVGSRSSEPSSPKDDPANAAIAAESGVVSGSATASTARRAMMVPFGLFLMSAAAAGASVALLGSGR